MRYIALCATALLTLFPLSAPLLAQNQSRIYYAPDVNLEQADLATIESARHSIDAALYSALTRNYALPWPTQLGAA